MSVPAADRLRFGPDGLIVAVAQAERDGRVLMVAYMDERAYRLTVETGQAHFWSRSRGRLWRKGETSGNTLRVKSIEADCDGDAILLTVDAAGPTCHLGRRSCFAPEPQEPHPEEGVPPG